VHPELQDKVLCFIGLGTVVSLEGVDNHLVLKYLAKFRAVEFLRLLGFKTILHLPDWVTRAIGVLIYNTKFYFSLFFGIVNILCGTPNRNKIDKERLGVIISHQPGGASIPNVLQWIQFYRSGKVKKYDYGKKKNLEKYQL
jgi:lysosomal acid lipase/cholesteryl ester hydrolase